MRLNPLTFTCSKVNKDPQGFTDEMEKIFSVIYIFDFEEVEFAVY